jgi:hypothetical protein
MTDILSKYADIIAPKKFILPPYYNVIQFDSFIQRELQGQNKFIQNFDVSKINAIIRETTLRQDDFFKKNNEPIDITFKSLFYYQKDVGLEGPQYSNCEDPVFVIIIEEKEILFNGYHRALKKILNGEKSIMAYRKVL